jgi:hypothetical protein
VKADFVKDFNVLLITYGDIVNLDHFNVKRDACVQECISLKTSVKPMNYQ